MTIGQLFLTEDEALKNLLKGMVVTDQRANSEGATRPVGVWFGMPDQELREQSFPYMTIDLIDIGEERDRAMRGTIDESDYDYFKYMEPDNLPQGKGAKQSFPIPVFIDYQITTFARHPRHDRQILSDLLYTRLPLRFGSLSTTDETIRRLDVLDIAKRDLVEQGKRLYSNAIRVRISSEMPLTQYRELFKVQKVTTSGPLGTPRGRFTGVETFTITPQ
jgi:hypothetical protein